MSGARMPRRDRPVAAPPRAGRRRSGLSLAVLVVNQLIAGIGVAAGIAVAALLAEDLTGTTVLAGFAQAANVLGAAVAAIPLARLAVRSGRHVALAAGYALGFVGAALVVAAAVTGWAPLVFIGLLAFGAGTAAGLQSRFAATELAAPGYEARSMSLVLWATTIGSVAGPLLSDTGDRVGQALGLPALAGPFVFSGAAFAIASLLVGALLRLPRPGALAEDAGGGAAPAAPGSAPGGAESASTGVPADAAGTQLPASRPEARADPEPRTGSAGRVGAFRALGLALREPRSRFAVLAIVCAQTVMVGVMVMTPVHMYAHGLDLQSVGVVLAVHVLGMYGASPIMGWLVDRIGAERVIGLAVLLFAAAIAIGILAPPHDLVLLPLALGLLGLGWSAGLIGGSTLVTLAVAPAVRVPLQGATDAAMNVAAAVAAAGSGLLLAAGGFAGVNVVAALVLAPLLVAGALLAVRSRRAAA